MKPKETIRLLMSKQCDVRNGNATEDNKSNQTDDEQSAVRNGNATGDNKSNQTDDGQPDVQHGQNPGKNKAVSQFTVIDKQSALLSQNYTLLPEKNSTGFAGSHEF